MEIFMNVLGLVIAIIMLGVLVFVHEFGHLIMAKIGGIAVDAFSVGFGKEIFGFNMGETRYRVSVFPFGGYCRMRGETDRIQTTDANELDGNGDALSSMDSSVPSAPDSRALYNRPPLARLGAVIGGPLFNGIFAVVLMTGLFLAGFSETLIVPKVAVVEEGSDGKPTPAVKAGLKTGDELVSIGGVSIEGFNDIVRAVALRKGQELPVSWIREGITNNATVTPEYNTNSGLAYIGLMPLYSNVIGIVRTNSPAEKAGLKAGDVVLAVGTNPVTWYHEIDTLIAPYTNMPVSFLIRRGTNLLTNEVLLGRFDGKGYLGVYPGALETRKKVTRAENFTDAVSKGFMASVGFVGETLDGLRAMFTGAIDVQRNISGPVRIIQLSAEVATKTDLTTFIRFMALISVALGFFNLLPLPGLDGGHVMFNLIELLTRRRFPEGVRRWIEAAGLILLVGLFVAVLANDITNIALKR